MRHGIEVRSALPEDMDGLVALCLTARRESSVGSQVCSADADALAQQLGTLTTAPGGTVLTAMADDVVVGLLLARVVGPSLFTDAVSLAVEALYVGPEHRRRGVGHALMAGATQTAVAAGAVQVYASPIPGARGMQRFLVQLGFAPAAAHRVVTTTALQRRLAESTVKRGPGHRRIDDLIARRRQLRAEATPTAEAPSLDQPARRSISRQVKRAVQTRREAESSTTTS